MNVHSMELCRKLNWSYNRNIELYVLLENNSSRNPTMSMCTCTICFLEISSNLSIYKYVKHLIHICVCVCFWCSIVYSNRRVVVFAMDTTMRKLCVKRLEFDRKSRTFFPPTERKRSRACASRMLSKETEPCVRVWFHIFAHVLACKICYPSDPQRSVESQSFDTQHA